MSPTRTGRACGKNSRLSIFENLERRQHLDASVRNYDGTGNNIAHPNWGSTVEELLRVAAPDYTDGVSSPAGADRPSARAISNAIVDHPDEEIANERHLAAYIYAWGQFIDHDLDLTTAANPTESFPVQVPTGDTFFDPAGTGTQVIPLRRSNYTGGTSSADPREQINDITAYIDGSMVYGSTESRALALRTLVGGRLKTSEGDLLPFNTMGLPNDVPGNLPADSFFVAGDIRANENIELMAMQTLFLREHNRLADQIAAQNPTWNDEKIYQRARRLVIGEIQFITFNEYLPALLGENAIRDYRGYRSNVNVGVNNEFSTAAFRIGHSQLADDVEFMDNNGNDTHEEVPLAEAFNNVPLLLETGIDPILKYLASSNAEELDNMIVGGVRNFLFGPPGAGGLDLASLNIQRGRDHGLADYNTVRDEVGLSRVTSFSQITSNVELQNALQETYGSVENIDLWVGGLAEDHVRGSSLGPTFQRIIVDQFTRVRDGDRFWYERDLSRSDERFVENSTLTNVLKRNTELFNLQDSAFVFNTTISGRIWNDRDGDGRVDRGENGIRGRVVELVDDEGVVVDSTSTNRDGNYFFEGVQIGAFDVRPVVPSGWEATTDAQDSVTVTRGQRFAGVNFGQRQVTSTPTAVRPDSTPTELQSALELIDPAVV